MVQTIGSIFETAKRFASQYVGLLIGKAIMPNEVSVVKDRAEVRKIVEDSNKRFAAYDAGFTAQRMETDDVRPASTHEATIMLAQIWEALEVVRLWNNGTHVLSGATATELFENASELIENVKYHLPVLESCSAITLPASSAYAGMQFGTAIAGFFSKSLAKTRKALRVETANSILSATA